MITKTVLFLRKKHRQIKITETSVVVDSIEFDLFSEFELKRIEIRSRWIDRSKTWNTLENRTILFVTSQAFKKHNDDNAWNLNEKYLRIRRKTFELQVVSVCVWMFFARIIDAIFGKRTDFDENIARKACWLVNRDSALN